MLTVVRRDGYDSRIMITLTIHANELYNVIQQLDTWHRMILVSRELLNDHLRFHSTAPVPLKRPSGSPAGSPIVPRLGSRIEGLVVAAEAAHPGIVDPTGVIPV
jgi:hypothetical protein